MSIIVDLTEAIKTHVASVTLSDSHTTERVYILDLDREAIAAMQGLAVHVLPSAPEIAPYTRANGLWDIEINVVITNRIEQQLADQLLGQIDAAMNDVETLMDSLKAASFLIGSTWHSVAGIAQASIYDDSMLKDSGVFQSVFTVGFKAVR